MSFVRPLAFALLLLATTGCGTIRLTAPPPPPPTMPAGEEALVLPANGGARVLVSTDVPARVVLVSGGEVTTANGESHYVEPGTLLCASTPCSIGMPYGDYDLELEGLGGKPLGAVAARSTSCRRSCGKRGRRRSGARARAVPASAEGWAFASRRARERLISGLVSRPRVVYAWRDDLVCSDCLAA